MAYPARAVAFLAMLVACSSVYGESTSPSPPGPADVLADAAAVRTGDDASFGAADGGAKPCTGGAASANDADTGHCYILFEQSVSWSAARDACFSTGAHLVTISSQVENLLVVSMTGQKTVWTGANDIGTEGEFIWLTGETFANYTNFKTGEPDPSTSAGEDCVEMRANGSWNDADCASTASYVCERD